MTEHNSYVWIMKLKSDLLGVFIKGVMTGKGSGVLWRKKRKSIKETFEGKSVPSILKILSMYILGEENLGDGRKVDVHG